MAGVAAPVPPTASTFVNAKLFECVEKWKGDKGKWKLMRIQLFNYFDGVDVRIRSMMYRCEGFQQQISLSILSQEERAIAGGVRVALGTVFRD